MRVADPQLPRNAHLGKGWEWVRMNLFHNTVSLAALGKNERLLVATLAAVNGRAIFIVGRDDPVGGRAHVGDRGLSRHHVQACARSCAHASLRRRGSNQTRSLVGVPTCQL